MNGERVTLQDVYAVVNRLEDKVDNTLTAYSKRMDNQDGKISTIESKVSNIEGRSFVYSILFSGIVSAVMYNIRSFFSAPK